MSEKPGNFEDDVVSPTQIIKIGALLFATLPLALLIIGASYRLELGHLPNSGTHRTNDQGFPAPRLEIDPQHDLAEYRARQDQKLHAKAAIPIEKAMALIAARGNGAYAPLKATSPPTPARTSP